MPRRESLTIRSACSRRSSLFLKYEGSTLPRKRSQTVVYERAGLYGKEEYD